MKIKEPSYYVEASGLTWRGLAARVTVTEGDATALRRVEPSRWRPGHRGIVALARDLTGRNGG